MTIFPFETYKEWMYEDAEAGNSHIKYKYDWYFKDFVKLQFMS